MTNEEPQMKLLADLLEKFMQELNQNIACKDNAEYAIVRPNEDVNGL